jgi:thioredoxin reductase (NADPH)
MKKKKDKLISGDTKKILQRDFARLEEPVTILLFTSENENVPFNEYSHNLLVELSEISEKIRPQFEKIGNDLSKKHNVTRTPTLLIQPDKYNIRFTGAPAGEEAQTFMVTIMMVSSGRTILSDGARQRLNELSRNRNIKVFVSPT